MKIQLVSILAVLLFTCASFAQLGRPEQLSANVSRVNLTPPLEWQYSLGGYGERMSKPAAGIHDSIWVKALVIKDAQKKYALITMDILALPPNVKPEVLTLLAAGGWKSDNLMLLPSHSHASLDMSAINDKNNLNNPYIGFYDPRLLEFVVNAIVKAVKQADQDYKLVKIGTGREEVSGMNRNRRGENGVDEDLTVTRIDLGDNKPLAVLVNWTAHPTITGSEDMLVSGEWPGFLQKELENLIDNNVLCMYFNGAEGDQSYVLKSREGDHYQQAEAYGKAMAAKAFSTYNTLKPAPISVFAYNSVTCKLPEPRLHPGFADTGGEEYGINEQSAPYIFEAMCPASTEISALRLGDLLIVGAPGEMTYSLGGYIKKQLESKGVAYPVIGGLANEWLSYILSPAQYAKGGYEASVSFYGPELGPLISQSMMKAAGSLTN